MESKSSIFFFWLLHLIIEKKITYDKLGLIEYKVKYSKWDNEFLFNFVLLNDENNGQRKKGKYQSYHQFIKKIKKIWQ